MARRFVPPNLLDRAISYVAPRVALERHKSRQALAASGYGGSYHGARRDRRATSEWDTGGGSADFDLLPDLPTLRERSRDLARNAPIAGGAINTAVTNVVGTGLKVKPQVNSEVLKLSEAAADAWERKAAHEFALWAKSTDCDITRTQNFAGLQDLAFRSTLENGDAFVLARYKPLATSIYGLRLQLFEADRVCNPDRAQDTAELAGGVALDGDGAPRGYHVTNRHPGDFGAGQLTWQFVPAFGPRSGQRQVLHLYRKLRIGQTRGVPYLAPVVEILKQISRYSDAEIMAAVVSSCFAIVTETPNGSGLDLESSGQTSPNGNPIKITESGQMVDLAEGERLQNFTPERPNGNFDPFVLALLRQIGVALELPFEILVKHFTASYSAARAALLEAWKFFIARREWLAGAFCQPAYEWWLAEAVAIGRIEAPGFYADPAIRAAWCGAEWYGPAQGQIDPAKEIEAAKTAVELGVKTLQQVTAEITGGDWERNHPQRVKEHRMREQAGLEVAPTPPGKALPAPPGPAEGENDQPERKDAA